MTTAVAKREVSDVKEFSAEQLEIIKSVICGGDATDNEFKLFVEVAKSQNLDPFKKQIYFIKRDGKMTIVTGIDGMRAIAFRSGQVNGTEGPYWCGKDGVWKDVWLDDAPPAAAKVIEHRKDCEHPYVAIALWSAYAETTMTSSCPKCGKDAIIKGKPEYGGGWICFARKGGCGAKFTEQPPATKEVYQARWAIDGANMLAKCAEALCKRKAYPELGGLYTDDELGLPAAGETDVTGSVTVEPAKAAPAEVVTPTVEPTKALPPKAELPKKAPAAARVKPVAAPAEPPKVEAPAPTPVVPEVIAPTPVAPTPVTPPVTAPSDPAPATPIEPLDADPDDKTPLLHEEKRVQILETFAKIGVTQRNLEFYLGVKSLGWTESCKTRLLKKYSSVTKDKQFLDLLKQEGN